MHTNYSPYWAISEAGARALETRMPEIVNTMCGRIVAAGRIKIEPPQIATMKGDTAIIDVQGVMVKRESWFTALGYGASTLAVARAVDEAVADEKVKSIVLNIDSPGGTVDGQHALVEAVQKARKAKPVIAQVDGLAASAGYWLASAADAIYAGPGDEVGSIGVRLMLYDFSRAFENAGVEAVPIDTGKYKSAGAFGTEITDDQRAYFQTMVDAYFRDFYADVRRGRKLSDARAKEVSDGRTFIARDALDLGLIDGIGNLESTLKAARRLTGRSNQTAKARARWREMAV